MCVRLVVVAGRWVVALGVRVVVRVWGWVLVLVLVVLGWLWWELVMALHAPATVGDVSVLDSWDGVGDDV